LLNTKNEGADRVRETEKICRKLKYIALQYNVCIIALSQLSRSVEERKGSKFPLLTDIPDAGSVLPFADKVIFIYRPAYYGIDEDEDGNDMTKIAEIIVTRNRSGETGIIPLLIGRQFTNYLDWK
jgi:replicative DNA helicase